MNFLDFFDSFDLEEHRLKTLPSNQEIELIDNGFPASFYNPATEFMAAEEAFLTRTYFSESMEDIFLYNDFPLIYSEKSEDVKRWMFLMTKCLDKGHRVIVMHDLTRPSKETYNSLYLWLALYLSGDVVPYYLGNDQSDIFRHELKTSGAAALLGEGVRGSEKDGLIVVSSAPEALAYAKKREMSLRALSSPLMQIYRKKDRKAFSAFLKRNSTLPGDWYQISSAPPIYTVPDELLEEVMDRNGASAATKSRILDYKHKYLKLIEKKLSSSDVSVVFPAYYTRGEKTKTGPRIRLAGSFFAPDIYYDEKEYRALIKAAKDFAKANPRFHIQITREPIFTNTQLTICEDKYAVLTKCNAPVTHFVIDHPRMLKAMKHFMIPKDES